MIIMKYKGLLLDIDNTLYNYNDAHKIALKQLILATHKKTSKKIAIIKITYIEARTQINIELSETASSHNRLLYIQRMLELLNENSMNLSLKLYNIYWDTFLDTIKLYNGVLKFMQNHQDKLICFVTDLTANIQHRKIERLGLYKYANYIVTSEEVGKEKPHPYMFILALKKMGINANEACMIGDSYKKDILGASRLGIQSYWLYKNNIKNNIKNKLIVGFQNFEELERLINE